jgi:hypothetical protein
MFGFDKVDYLIAAVGLLTCWVAMHEWRLFKLEGLSQVTGDILEYVMESLWMERFCEPPGSVWSKVEQTESKRRAA